MDELTGGQKVFMLTLAGAMVTMAVVSFTSAVEEPWFAYANCFLHIFMAFCIAVAVVINGR